MLVVHGDAVVVVVDAVHRSVEPDAVAEQRGQPHRDLHRAVGEAGLLGAVDDPDHLLQAAAGPDVEERMQQRDLARLGREEGAGHGPQPDLRTVAVGLRLDPGLHRHAVELHGVRVLPGRGQVELHGGGGQVDHRLHQVARDHRVAGRDRTVVAQQLAVPQLQVVTVGVLRERLEPELLDQRVHPVLGRTDPLTAVLDESLAVLDRGVGPTADPVACLEDDDLPAGIVQLASGRESGQTCADDHHVTVELRIHHAPMLNA